MFQKGKYSYDSVSVPGLLNNVNVDGQLVVEQSLMLPEMPSTDARTVTVKNSCPLVGNEKTPASKVTEPSDSSELPYDCEFIVPDARSKKMVVLPPPVDPAGYPGIFVPNQ